MKQLSKEKSSQNQNFQKKQAKITLPNFIKRPNQIYKNEKSKKPPVKKSDLIQNKNKIFKKISEQIVQYFSNQCIHEQPKINKDTNNRKTFGLKQQDIKINQKESTLTPDQKQILNILKYLLNQYQPIDLSKKIEETPYQVWQKKQIQNNLNNLSVGMFAIKLPNPDNPPLIFVEKYKSLNQKEKQDKDKKSNKNEIKEIEIRNLSLKQTLDLYQILFDIEDQQNKNLADKQYIAFILAYYLLSFKEASPHLPFQNIEEEKNEQQKQQIQNLKQKDQKSQDLLQENPIEKKISKQMKQQKVKPPNQKQQKQKRIKRQKQVKIIAQRASKQTKYYLLIQGMSYFAYHQKRREPQNIFKTLETQMNNQQLINKIQHIDQLYDNKKDRQELRHYFDELKFYLYKRIRGTFKNYQKIIGGNALDYKLQPQIQEEVFLELRQIFKYIENISDILLIFHLYIPRILDKCIRQSQQIQKKQRDMFYQTNDQDQQKYKRLLCRGSGLRKKLSNQNQAIWYRYFRRPKDVLTLIRNMMVYKLTKRSNLFVRQFLSKNQDYIFLVIDCTDQIIEKYTQSYQSVTQVQLGAIDIFSFEPVDSYYRPLRLNKYIKQASFRKKYEIKNDVQKKQPTNKIPEQSSNSIQNKVLGDYVKTLKLNDHQLRYNIINDQDELIDTYKYIAKQLKINYVDGDEILQNEYNSEIITRSEWEVYYIYTKLLIQYCSRIRKTIERYQKLNKIQMQEGTNKTKKKVKKTPNKQLILNTQIKDNIGLIYRLIFQKAMEEANKIYRQNNNFNYVQSCLIKLKYFTKYFSEYRPLKNLWQIIGINQPTCYAIYINKPKYNKIWRKYEINEKKERSKFVSSQKIYILNKIFQKSINIGSGIYHKLIFSYFPSHDPYILKGIKLAPYFKIFTDDKLIAVSNRLQQQSKLKSLLKQFASTKTSRDFAQKSIQQKLELDYFSPSKYTDLSIEVIKNYSGQKISLYFHFIKFITEKSIAYIPAALIFEIIFFIEYNSILKTTTSSLTQVNNYLVLFYSFINMMFMVDITQNWKHQERQFQIKYGLANLSQQTQKRNLFQGSFKRNIQDDNMNFQYTPPYQRIIKLIISNFISLVFIGFVVVINYELLILKSILIEVGLPQTISNNLPSILISLLTLICNQLYSVISKILTEFQNPKTISQFQNSIIFKNFSIQIINTFISILFISFFSSFFTSVNLCFNPISDGFGITNCSCQVQNLLLSNTIISLLPQIAGAIMPILLFYKNKFFSDQEAQYNKTAFIKNYYQAIDQFYQEQDKMTPFMYNQQIDNTSLNYMTFILRLTTIALFGPALPLAMLFLYIHGVIALHSNKFKILFVSQRSLPVKAKSIGSWLNILQVMGFLGILINLCYTIFTRTLTSTQEAKVFFGLTLLLIFFRFYLGILYQQPNKSQIILSKRNQHNLNKVFLGVSKYEKKYAQQKINTDISNVDYSKVDRKLPEMNKIFVKQ